eukprot:424139-Rhodomonas_salina.1
MRSFRSCSCRLTSGAALRLTRDENETGKCPSHQLGMTAGASAWASRNAVFGPSKAPTFLTSERQSAAASRVRSVTVLFHAKPADHCCIMWRECATLRAWRFACVMRAHAWRRMATRHANPKKMLSLTAW